MSARKDPRREQGSARVDRSANSARRLKQLTDSAERDRKKRDETAEVERRKQASTSTRSGETPGAALRSGERPGSAIRSGERPGSARREGSAERASARQRANDSGSAERRREEREVGRAAKLVLMVLAVLLVVSAALILMSDEKARALAVARLRGNQAKGGGNSDNSPGGARDPLPGRVDAPIVRAPRGPARPKERLVQGRVVDINNRPVSPASLRALRTRMSVGRVDFEALGVNFPTDLEGHFSAYADTRATVLEIRARGFATRLVPLDGAEGASWDKLEIVLANAERFNGQVLAAETGAPIAGATITAESASWRASIQSDNDGRFSFEDAPAESIAILATAPGRVPSVQDGQRDMTIALLEGRSVRGQVVDIRGAPVANAEVLIFGSDHPGVPLTARSGADGQFLARGLDLQEEFLAHARAQGVASPLEGAWLRPDAESVQIIVVPTGTVIIRDADPSFVEFLPVLTQPGFDLPAPSQDPRGLRYDALAPGRYELSRVGDPAPALSILVRGGDEHIIDPPAAGEASPIDSESLGATQALSNGPPIQVMVVDHEGQPLPGVLVSADPGLPGLSLTTAQTDNNGRVELPRVSSRVRVTADAPGRMLVNPTELGPDVAEITLTVVQPVPLKGRVDPACSAEVTLVDPYSGTVVREVQSGADGLFVMEGLIPGRYILEVSADGYAIEKLGIQLPLRGEGMVVPLHQGGEHHHLPDSGQ